MASTSQNGTQTRIIELKRTGSGQLQESGNVFVWTGLAHSSPRDTISPKLGTKIVRKEMPGSNEVVHQALAATWQPFEIKGEWRDIWMGTGQAFQTYQDFAKMCSRIPLVRVHIDQLSFVGLIQDPTFVYHHSGWIDYSFTLSPEEHETIDEQQVSFDDLTEKRSIASWAKDAADQVGSLDDANAAAADIPLKTEQLSDATTTLSALDDATAQVESIVNLSSATNLSQDIVSLTKGAGEDTSRLLLVLPNAYEQIRRSAIDVALAFRDERADNNVAFDDLIQILSFEQWKSDLVAGSWRASGLAADAAKDARARSQDKPKAIYRPFPGESLERVSMRFYGTPNNADLIRQKNHLASIFLTGVEELIIPDV